MNRIGLAVSLAAAAALAGGCHRVKDMTGEPVKIEGSYARTCRGVQNAADGTMKAECMDAQSHFHVTTIDAGACRLDIANVNGVLTCSH